MFRLVGEKERDFKSSRTVPEQSTVERSQSQESWGSTGCTQARPSASQCSHPQNSLGKERPGTTDSGCAGVGRGRRMGRSPRSWHLVPARCQESSWSRSIGGATGHSDRIPGCVGMGVERTAGSGGEGDDGCVANCFPQRRCCKNRSA